MSIDDITHQADEAPTAAAIAAQAPPEEAELTQAQQDTKDAAIKRRIEGGSRIDALNSMTSAGISPEKASGVIDSMDEIMFVLHGIRHNDVSSDVDAKIAALQAENPREVRAPMTKKPEQLLKEAQLMAARAQSRGSIVTYLKENGASDSDAKAVASKVTGEMSAARANFEQSKKKAKTSASWRIGIGVLLLVVGLSLMSSGTETSGRRSPGGAVLIGLVTVGSGIYEMTKAGAQSFEGRVREVLK